MLEQAMQHVRQFVGQSVQMDALPVKGYDPVVLGGVGVLALITLLYLRKPLAARLTRINPLRRRRLKKRITAATTRVEGEVKEGSTPYDPEKVERHIAEAQEYVESRRYKEAHRELNKIENILR